MRGRRRREYESERERKSESLLLGVMTVKWLRGRQHGLESPD
jgi:hypothetical protein